MRVHQQAAFVLLNRPYSESSWIMEVFSRQHGRLALMAKGARRQKSRNRGVLLPFQPLSISWSGKGEIPVLTGAEIDWSALPTRELELRGDALVCGFYCNELLVNSLHRNDPHPALYDAYADSLAALMGLLQEDQSAEQSSARMASLLRDFERVVLKECGYEVNFEFEADGKTPIAKDRQYRFQSGRGFVADQNAGDDTVSGELIVAIGNGSSELHQHHRLHEKQLMRAILSQTTGNKEIISRELFFPRAR